MILLDVEQLDLVGLSKLHELLFKKINIRIIILF